MDDKGADKPRDFSRYIPAIFHTKIGYNSYN